MGPGPESDPIIDWAVSSSLQPKPVTVDIWRQLPEAFCREAELVNGQVVRCDKPSRQHQVAAGRIVAAPEAVAGAHMAAEPASCPDTTGDFDVLLWEVPATVRSPDAALFDCAPPDERPRLAHRVKVIVEVVSPGSRKVDKVDKMAQYAAAGIPFCWLVAPSGNHVLSIDIHVLDHITGQYRHHRTLTPEEEISTVEVPVRIRIDWARLTNLVREP